MENKNFISGIFIGILIGAIIFGSVGVVAVTLTANQVTYTPSDSEFNVNNVKGAIDELYQLSKSKPTTGSYIVLPLISGAAGSNNQSFSATDITGYQGLTADDFVYVSTTIVGWARHENPLGYVMSTTISPTISYDASTGIVSVTGTGGSYSNTYGAVSATANGEVI